MGLIVIVGLVWMLWAYRTGRPLKLILSPQEAALLRAHWWQAARRELMAWIVVTGIGFAVFAQPLADMQLSRDRYFWMVWSSLLLFSRMAIWVSVIVLIAGYTIGIAAYILGHPLYSPATVMIPFAMCVIAIIIRCVFTFLYVSAPRKEQLQTMAYPLYLRTPEWNQKRKEALRRAGYRCELCGVRESLDVHHKTYVRRGDEWPEDLVALCGRCHEREDEIRRRHLVS